LSTSKLANYTDYIVVVAEHAQGGFLVEQRYFTALEKCLPNNQMTVNRPPERIE
jgi:hypothetical protein